MHQPKYISLRQPCNERVSDIFASDFYGPPSTSELTCEAATAAIGSGGAFSAKPHFAQDSRPSRQAIKKRRRRESRVATHGAFIIRLHNHITLRHGLLRPRSSGSLPVPARRGGWGTSSEGRCYRLRSWCRPVSVALGSGGLQLCLTVLWEHSKCSRMLATSKAVSFCQDYRLNESVVFMSLADDYLLVCCGTSICYNTKVF